MYRIQGFYIYR